MENEYIDMPGGFELPTGEEVRFFNYLEEYLLNKEKGNPNITLGKIDLPGFTVFGIHEIILISRKFGFIERLVENDKLKDNGIKPRTDLVKEIQIVDYETGKALGWENQYSETEQLIMYLSIQDNPIECLCSILR